MGVGGKTAKLSKAPADSVAQYGPQTSACSSRAPASWSVSSPRPSSSPSVSTIARASSSRWSRPAPPCRLDLILVENFLGAATRQRIERLLGRLTNTTLRWLSLDTAPIADAPVGLHFSPAMYGRILAFDAISDRNRLLYLDCDMIC